MVAEEGLLADPWSLERANVRHRDDGALHGGVHDDDDGAFQKHPSEGTIWAACFDD